jgi:hypothetical protein
MESASNCSFFYCSGRPREDTENSNVTSSNHDWFVERTNGDDSVYELEALNPQDMIDDLEKTPSRESSTSAYSIGK